MRGLFRHALVATGVSVVLLIPATGLAGTSGGPALILSPTTSTGTYNYGTLDAGQTASQTFTITNSGGRVPGWGAFPLLLASLLAHALVHDAASAAHDHYLLL